MRSARFLLALQSDDVVLPKEGKIAVIGPQAKDNLSELPQARIEVVQGFRPDYDHFAAQGLAVSATLNGPYTAAILCLPRARAAAQAMVAGAAAAVEPGGLILVDGQKTDGVDAMLRACRALVPLVLDPLSKAHGKIFGFAADRSAFADWVAAPQMTPDGFTTAPGVFSADGADLGSALLAKTLPERMRGRIADLGAGWGYLSAAALTRRDVTEVHLIEADHAALACAKVNITDPRAQFHWADATVFAAKIPATARFDWVISNPPFHTTRAADPSLGIAFIRAAARMLTGSGTCLIVANRHLPYEHTLSEVFGMVTVLAETSGFKVFSATRPKTAGSGTKPAGRIAPRPAFRSVARPGVKAVSHQRK